MRSGHRGPLCQPPLHLDPSQKSSSLNRDPSSQPNDCQVGVEDQGRGRQDPSSPQLSNWLPHKLGMAVLSELGLASLKPGHLPGQPGPAPPFPSQTLPSGLSAEGKETHGLGLGYSLGHGLWARILGSQQDSEGLAAPVGSPLLKATPDSLGRDRDGTLLSGSFLLSLYLYKSPRSFGIQIKA